MLRYQTRCNGVCVCLCACMYVCVCVCVCVVCVCVCVELSSCLSLEIVTLTADPQNNVDKGMALTAFFFWKC